jgi:two-component system, cell cycle response regulator
MEQAIPLARTVRAARLRPGRRDPHRRGGAPVGVERLSRALAERAPRLAAHQRAVAELAGLLGRRIGLSGRDLRAVTRAAELHDIGKVLVPDAILNKRGALTDAELELMRRHAVAGYLILVENGEPAPVPRLVRASHERWDGSGYPDGLAGEDIPLGARIIAVCDAYDAMTHERPYRPARPPAAALEELRRGAGVRYDPRLVAAFVAALDGSA